MNGHKFPFEWRLADGFPAAGIKYHGSTVFSCFAGGGGSSMGYKLAGYNVLGCCEIDDMMSSLYEHNLKPKFLLKTDIRNLIKGVGVPDELYDLDVLDGSPPCTLFSSALPSAELQRGKVKKFREGQTEQILDDLFFWFIDLAKTLNPRVIIAENVMGMLKGSAKKYVQRVMGGMNEIGYSVIVRPLNGADMGLPQLRNRVFFLAIRNDLMQNIGSTGMISNEPTIDLKFQEQHIIFQEIMDRVLKIKGPVPEYKLHTIPKFIMEHYDVVGHGHSFSEVHPNGSFFNNAKIHPRLPVFTITTFSDWTHLHPYEKRGMSPVECTLCSSFPLDYNYLGNSPYYVMGMSVPPIMMAQVSDRVYNQWIKKIKGGNHANSETTRTPRRAHRS